MRLTPFKLERYFAHHEFSAEYLLCSSDCESLAVGELLALEPGADERLLRQQLGYTETQGAPALRRAIGRLYASVGLEQVLVHSGAEEAIFLFMHAALAPGDHVVVHTPAYQSLAEVARAIGCEVSPWQADSTRGWALDLDELRGLLRERTRVIVVNLPHNPTGYLLDHAAFAALAGLADERGITLFSDEVYRESEYALADRLPAACDLSARAVSLGVLSKTYGLAGLRIGWVATHDAALLARMAALKDYTTICNSAPSELLAELALRHRAALVARNLGIIARNLALLDQFFAAHADTFVWRRPLAGPVAFPQLVGRKVDTFCHDLVSAAGVLLLPGTVYDDPGNHFRIGFGRRNMPAALERLAAFLGR